jgi:hypothetical protein
MDVWSSLAASIGYYKLTKPKEKAADWVWIVDHTIQLGVEK